MAVTLDFVQFQLNSPVIICLEIHEFYDEHLTLCVLDDKEIVAPSRLPQ